MEQYLLGGTIGVVESAERDNPKFGTNPPKIYNLHD